MIEQIKDKNNFWLRLDNAAKIYPAIKDQELTSVFRVGVELKERVKIKPLLEAVQALENRFPYFKVKLKAGFFWYYLEPLNLPIAVAPDQGVPLRAFERDELMFRVLARENKISVEFSHILTDGTGGFEFLKTLLITYLEKCCLHLPTKQSILRPNEEPSHEEFEDAYNRYFRKTGAPTVKISKSFHLPFRLQRTPRFTVLTAIIGLEAIAKKAKEQDVSLTEYLTAVYLFCIQNLYNGLSGFKRRTSSKIIRIEVPVNLRRMFPSKTMRNFSLYVIPGIDLRLGHYSFEEILKTVHHQMQLETDKKLISKMISRNVSGERNELVRRIPLFIKSFVLSRLYVLGTAQYSGVVTNLGRVDLGPEINNLVEKFLFIPPPPNKTLKVNCGVVGFDNKLVMTFGNITVSKELERQFLTFLTTQNIPVKIVK